MRPNARSADQLRDISFEAGVSPYAEGSCLVKFGQTHVLCTASIDESVPRWMKGSGKGWVTAEYGMLPRATHSRNSREAARGKQGGRTVEIQRLIASACSFHQPASLRSSSLAAFDVRICCSCLHVCTRWL